MKSLSTSVKEKSLYGNNMIWIPKFYTKYLYHENVPLKSNDAFGIKSSSRMFMITLDKRETFSPYPAFVDPNGKERDGFYISQFEASEIEGKVCSKMTSNLPFYCDKETASAKASSIVPGGHIMSFWEYQAVLLLAIVNGFDTKPSTENPPADKKITQASYQYSISGSRVSVTAMDAVRNMPTNVVDPAFIDKPVDSYSINLSKSVKLYGLGAGRFEWLKGKHNASIPKDTEETAVSVVPRCSVGPGVSRSGGTAFCLLQKIGKNTYPANYKENVVFFWYNDQFNSSFVDSSALVNPFATECVVGGSFWVANYINYNTGSSAKSTINLSPLIKSSPFNIMGIYGNKPELPFHFCTYEKEE